MFTLAMLHFSPMESEVVNGRWALRYTNMPSVLGKFVGPGFRPKGEIYQDIDVPAQRMVNEQTTVLGPRNIVSSSTTTSSVCFFLYAHWSVSKCLIEVVHCFMMRRSQ
jgi:PAP_fibrillin